MPLEIRIFIVHTQCEIDMVWWWISGTVTGIATVSRTNSRNHTTGSVAIPTSGSAGALSPHSHSDNIAAVSWVTASTPCPNSNTTGICCSTTGDGSCSSSITGMCVTEWAAPASQGIQEQYVITMKAVWYVVAVVMVWYCVW